MERRGGKGKGKGGGGRGGEGEGRGVREEAGGREGDSEMTVCACVRVLRCA